MADSMLNSAPTPDATGKPDAPVDTPAPQAPTAPAAEKPDGKPATPAPTAPAVPDKYDLKLPENAALSASAIERIAATAKELGLSQEAAQKLLDHDNTVVSSHMEGLQADFAKQNEGWIEAVKSDKEIGGASFDANIAAARRAVDKYATPEFKAALNSTGFGNHPELVRMFVRIGKAMDEDKPPMPGNSQNGEARSPAEILYPTTK